MPNSPVMLSAEEYEALIAASAERDALRGELRLVTAQRDLAEEKLRAYKHELFGASSEARHADQLGLFNEAEALARTTDAPAREDVPGTLVAAHTRGKRGRKPLDPNLPREVVRHELAADTEACREAALDANHRACELRADQGDRLRAPHAAVVDTGIDRLPGLTDRRLQLVAPVESARCGEHRFAVEAAHRVAAADGQVVDVVERVARVLAVERRDVPERLLRNRERHRQVRIEHGHFVAVGRAAVGREDVVLRAERADALPVCERPVELRVAEIVAIGQAEFDERVVAALLRDLSVFDEALPEAARQSELRTEHVVLAARQHAVQLELHRFRVAAGDEGLVHAGGPLVVGVRVR